MLTRIFMAGILALLGSTSALAQGQAGSLSEIFKRVGGAVVVVHTSEKVVTRELDRQPVNVAGIGSGVLVDDGKVVTAAHVVQTADAVTVEFPGEVRIHARIVASDTAADLALLQLDRVPPDAVTAKLGDSDKAQVGDEVFVVGAPFGITHTLTVGHVSARRKSNITSGGMAATELFQTDAAINQGNSGGPMFDMNGAVIGIVSHIISRSGGSDGLGFVVTSNMAQRLLFDEPSVWNGIEGYLLKGELARAFNIPAPGVALLVQRVATGSPAEHLGMRGGSLTAAIGEEELIIGGDAILAVEGIGFGAPNAYETIRRRMLGIPKGGSIHVAVLRRGEVLELVGTVPR